VRKVEGRVRPVEAITENEELEAVGPGVEGSGLGDDGDDARFGDDGGNTIASKKGLRDVLETNKKMENDEDLDLEAGCGDFLLGVGCERVLV
jgi:hypothetical protein